MIFERDHPGSVTVDFLSSINEVPGCLPRIQDDQSTKAQLNCHNRAIFHSPAIYLLPWVAIKLEDISKRRDHRRAGGRRRRRLYFRRMNVVPKRRKERAWMARFMMGFCLVFDDRINKHFTRERLQLISRMDSNKTSM